jgi:uncharacterized membrane protein YqjE
MNTQQTDSSGIAERLARFTAALLEHFLALASLATWEAKEGIKQTLFCSILLFFALLLIFVVYFLLLAILIIVAISLWQLSLLLTLSLLALSHFLMIGTLLLFLYLKRPMFVLKQTRDELLNDIEALKQH